MAKWISWRQYWNEYLQSQLPIRKAKQTIFRLDSYRQNTIRLSTSYRMVSKAGT